MTPLASDMRAFRQRLLAGLIGFLLSLGIFVALSVNLILRHAGETGWANAIHFGIELLVVSCIAAMGVSWIAIATIDRVHHWLGWVHCARCGRTLTWDKCECDAQRTESFAAARESALRGRRHIFRRYRKRISSVIVGYLAVVPLAYVVTVLSPALGRDPLAMRWILFHVLLCGLFAVVGRLIVDVLAMLGLARRFRLRADVMLQLFVAWPIAAAVFMAVYEATR
jgi:hypothetical protein